MQRLKKSFEQFTITVQLLRWTLLVIPVALIAGSLVALFLWLLDLVTVFRIARLWLLFGLPAAGVLIYWLYQRFGKNSGAGNNLIMEEIHRPGGGVPARMAPLVLFTTLLTHLFGGSAGREGTAVQIGGSMAAWIARLLRLSEQDTRMLLMTGIAAGFGAVFGTPLTGAVFALEVLAIGVIRYHALIPCLIAALLADIVCSAWGIHHTVYTVQYHALHKIDWQLLLQVIVAGVAFGLTSWLFSKSMHLIKDTANRYIGVKWLIPAIGGVIILLLCYLTGTTDYTGLGVYPQRPGGASITAAFTADGGVTAWSWLWKLIFTAVTLGMGFKGGEVTPLFFMGAALGNTLALLLGAPVDLFAAMGFIAVFAGATNTPVACTLMGVELFGGEHVLYFAVACFTAYYFSGHTGIYSAQLKEISKMQQTPEQ